MSLGKIGVFIFGEAQSKSLVPTTAIMGLLEKSTFSAELTDRLDRWMI